MASKNEMSVPAISIIIPHYNRSQLILETIASVEAQTFKEWEIIIVDDGSEAKEWQNIFKLRNEKIEVCQRESGTRGPSAARNIGLAKAAGKYIIFLDSDDLLAPFCLQQRMAYMETNPQWEMAVFNMKQFYERADDSDLVFNKHFNDNEATLRNFLRLNIPWQLTSAIWQKKLLQTLGGFNEQMQYAEDPELHARAFLGTSASISIVENSKPDSYYRMPSEKHQNSAMDKDKSVLGRMQFVESLHKEIIRAKCSKDNKANYIKDLGLAYKNIVSLFFNDSKMAMPTEFRIFKNYCYQHKIISGFQKKASSFVIALWQKDLPLLRFFHLKGLLTKIYS